MIKPTDTALFLFDNAPILAVDLDLVGRTGVLTARNGAAVRLPLVHLFAVADLDLCNRSQAVRLKATALFLCETWRKVFPLATPEDLAA